MKTYILILLCAISTAIFAQDPKTGYAPVNGLKMYYETHGSGKPIVLLHGAFMTAGMTWTGLTPALSKDHQVIAFEFQGHGHTADINRPFSLEAFADDIAAAIKYLKLDSVDLVGYSLGGEVAMAVAIRHPEVVKRLISISAVSRHDGWAESTRKVFPMITPEVFAPTPIKSEYDKVAPDPKHFNDFIRKMVVFASTPFDLGNDNIKNIKAPTLLIFGDSDGAEPSHIVELFRLRGGWANADLGEKSNSQLAIFPNSSHTGLMMQTDQLLKTIQPFLTK